MGGRRWEGASAATQAALADAGYALGCAGACSASTTRWRRSHGATRAGAAAEFRNSVWYGEEPGRVERVIKKLME